MANVVREMDALGRITLRHFDELGNKTDEELVGSGYSTHYTYDCSNRLTQVEERHHNDPTLTTKYTYDYLGNRTSSIDPYGHTTTYTYDEFGRETSVTLPICLNKEGLPFSPTTKKAYNILGQLISQTDAMHGRTETEYTVRGDPYHILYPDRSQERFEYNLNGTLAKKWEKSGMITCYEYDTLQRVVNTKTYDLQGHYLYGTQNSYHRGNLVQTIDPMGTVTDYQYDIADRKIAETTQGPRGLKKTTYEYDALGRLTTTKQWINEQEYICQVEEFDLLNRVINVRVEDQAQKLLRKEHYKYDIAGNKTHTYVFTDEKTYSLTKTEYDSQRRPISQTDALGHTTLIQYEYIDTAIGKVLCKITTDPLNNQTLELHDPLGRVVSTERRNTQGQRIAFEEVWYDANGEK